MYICPQGNNATCCERLWELRVAAFRASRGSLPFLTVMRNGKPVTETYADLIPRGDSLAMRAEVGGVDTTNF